ncbi:MAG: bifunctional adenosylcobinamide kinase/adenosylcobinamide-phosphate guanylyltransferase [Synergistaceae bacterium]|nr:bifunctional adenosylcobinamide kinase/adenosylcobinamide-phosphate guanylyltransferase [Synergistota bacterium]NLM72122.1 bifunctional adenosylcobinamide kinase/adenosylcobinamide-phosphate guanylyltransferase [Synergistaceae bacterium]
MGRIVFVLGGARSGKSEWAEKRALEMEAEGRAVVYLATCERRPGDAEMADRITRHRSRRPGTWRTVEAPYSVAEEFEGLGPGTVVLMDCLSLWVSNLLLTVPEKDYGGASDELLSRVDDCLKAVRRSSADLILVSNETGCGVVPSSRLGRLYRDILGWANQAAAREADEVWLLVAGLPQRLK